MLSLLNFRSCIVNVLNSFFNALLENNILCSMSVCINSNVRILNKTK